MREKHSTPGHPPPFSQLPTSSTPQLPLLPYTRIKIAGQRVANASHLIAQLDEFPQWGNTVNRLTCAMGPKPSGGSFLLSKDAADQIPTDNQFHIEWTYHDGTSEKTVTFKNYSVTRSYAALRTLDSPVIVEVADARIVYPRFIANMRFNCRDPYGDEFHHYDEYQHGEETTTTRFKPQKILDRLRYDLYGPGAHTYTFDDPPPADESPENLDYQDQPIWQSITHLAAHCNHRIGYDPYTATPILRAYDEPLTALQPLLDLPNRQTVLDYQLDDHSYVRNEANVIVQFHHRTYRGNPYTAGEPYATEETYKRRRGGDSAAPFITATNLYGTRYAETVLDDPTEAVNESELDAEADRLADTYNQIAAINKGSVSKQLLGLHEIPMHAAIDHVTWLLEGSITLTEYAIGCPLPEALTTPPPTPMHSDGIVIRVPDDGIPGRDENRPTVIKCVAYRLDKNNTYEQLTDSDGDPLRLDIHYHSRQPIRPPDPEPNPGSDDSASDDSDDSDDSADNARALYLPVFRDWQGRWNAVQHTETIYGRPAYTIAPHDIGNVRELRYATEGWVKSRRIVPVYNACGHELTEEHRVIGHWHDDIEAYLVHGCLGEESSSSSSSSSASSPSSGSSSESASSDPSSLSSESSSLSKSQSDSDSSESSSLSESDSEPSSGSSYSYGSSSLSSASSASESSASESSASDSQSSDSESSNSDSDDSESSDSDSDSESGSRSISEPSGSSRSDASSSLASESSDSESSGSSGSSKSDSESGSESDGSEDSYSALSYSDPSHPSSNDSSHRESSGSASASGSESDSEDSESDSDASLSDPSQSDDSTSTPSDDSDPSEPSAPSQHSDESDDHGSDKSNAIVRASWTSTGYAALHVLEAPEVRFDDMMTVTVTDQNTTFPIDPKFIEVTERETIQVCGAVPDIPLVVGASVHDGSRLHVALDRLPPGPATIAIRLTAVRRGFLGNRFPERTKLQRDANERHIRSAYPRGDHE